MIGRTYAHFVDSLCHAYFAARFRAFFYRTRFFDNNVPFDNTAPIYLSNLPLKLGLGLGLDLKWHYFSIFHGK